MSDQPQTGAPSGGRVSTGEALRCSECGLPYTGPSCGLIHTITRANIAAIGELVRVVLGAGAAAGTFTCPRCLRVSAHPVDVAEGYCGACHDWTGAAKP